MADKKVETVKTSDAGVQRIQTKAEKRVEQEAFANELVTIKLFADNGKYKDDVYVCVNGEPCQIQRGVEVQIKRKFADAISSSQNQEQYAIAYIKGMQDDLSADKKELS